MSDGGTLFYFIIFLSFLFVFALMVSLQLFLTRKRRRIIARLQGIQAVSRREIDEEDVLNLPFWERTIGVFSRWIKENVGQIAPEKMITQIEEKLEKAGNPQNIKANDFLAFQVILGVTALFLGIWFLGSGNLTVNSVLLALVLAVLAVYLPWFVLGTMATNRKTEIRRNLPDIMDLLVVSVEAGMGFDMALMKVVERYQGTIAKEFQRALREIQLGKSRKDALKDMEKRVGLMELSSLVNAVVQSDQLGVGISEVLRLQADLIREKRQQWIEEQAMKAPVKMLFPLVFFIFPCIFIILLGPALISMMKTFSNM